MVYMSLISFVTIRAHVIVSSVYLLHAPHFFYSHLPLFYDASAGTNMYETQVLIQLTEVG